MPMDSQGEVQKTAEILKKLGQMPSMVTQSLSLQTLPKKLSVSFSKESFGLTPAKQGSIMKMRSQS